MKNFQIIILSISILSLSCNPLTIFGWKPELHRAAFDNDVVKLKKLLDKGANVDKQFWDNHVCSATPLHWAASKGSLGAAQLLISYGANVNALTSEGDTPLHIASGLSPNYACDLRVTGIGDGSYQVAEILLKAGANTLIKNNRGALPIHNAIRYGRIDLIKLFFNYGFDVNYRNEYGASLFVISGNIVTNDILDKKNSVLIAKFLISKGINIQSILPKKKTALHISAESGNEEHVKYLISIGFDPNKQDIDGNTPLHKAIINCHYETVKALIENGALTYIKNSEHQTAIEQLLKKTSCSNRDEILAVMLKTKL